MDAVEMAHSSTFRWSAEERRAWTESLLPRLTRKDATLLLAMCLRQQAQSAFDATTADEAAKRLNAFTVMLDLFGIPHALRNLVFDTAEVSTSVRYADGRYLGWDERRGWFGSEQAT